MTAPDDSTAPLSSEPDTTAVGAGIQVDADAPLSPASDPTAAESGIQTEQAPIELPPPPQPATSPLETFVRWQRILDGALVVVVLLVAFVLGLFPVRNSDFLLHRAVGRLVAHGQYDFKTDPFTFTSEGVRWVNHSWLFGLFSYGMHQLGDWGDPALIILKALLLAALAEIMIRLGRPPGGSLWLPAMFTLLAILALSPRAYLQPICISFLFLGLTLYLLELPRRRRTSASEPLPAWNARWFIPLLCALWVNLDAWFILGPIVVGLFLLGELLEGRDAPKGSVSNLFAVLVVSLVACLANPYHVFAFTLPDQLGLSPAGQELGKVTAFSSIFTSPWLSNYLSETSGLPVYRSPAGLAYYPLAFLSLASFILTPGSWRNWRGPVWLAFFLLSGWHARAIPFFAIVAGPITALNFFDFNAQGSPASVTLDSIQLRRLLSFRVLTLVIGFAALVLGTAGWLHYPVLGKGGRADNRRPGWWLEFDPAAEGVARQLADWHEQKRIPDDARWFNNSSEAIGYLAWYAPGVRGFMDTRFSLYSADVARDFISARNSLIRNGLIVESRDQNSNARQAADEQQAAGDNDKWKTVFTDRKIAFVIVNESDTGRRGSMLNSLMSLPDEWTLCSLHGSSAVFGWNQAPGHDANSYSPIRYDSERLAFGPGADPAPRTGTKPPVDLEWWQILWQPEPQRSADLDDANVHLQLFDKQRGPTLIRDELTAFASLVGSAGAGVGPVANGTIYRLRLCFIALNEKEGKIGEVLSSRRDEGPPAELYLAVRAARRALANNPEDGRAWLTLARAYSGLARMTRERIPGFAAPLISEIRQTQMVAALNRAVFWDRELEPAHQLLVEHYQANQFIDLMLDHVDTFRKILASHGQKTEAIDAEIQKLQKVKKEREDQFVLDSANKPPFQRAQIALKHGLAESALKILLEQLQTRDADADKTLGQSLELALRLLLTTGRIDEARTLIDFDATRPRPLLARPADFNLPAGDWYRLQIVAAAGDYADADRMLDEMIRRVSQIAFGKERMPHDVTVLVPASVGNSLLENAVLATGVPGVATYVAQVCDFAIDLIPQSWLQATQMTAELLGRQSDLQTLRGWLALEAGDIATAKNELQEAIARAGKPEQRWISFHSQPLAQMLLDLIASGEQTAEPVKPGSTVHSPAH